MDILELKREFQTYEEKINKIRETLKVEEREKKITNLEKKTTEDGFWNDKRESQEIIKIINENKNLLNEYKSIETLFHDEEILLEFIDMGEDDFIEELNEKHKKLNQEIEDLDIKLLLDGKYDDNNAIITIHSGAGGTEACDWVEMLYRMYSRWFANKNYKVSQLDYMAGDSVGIKSITLLVEGEYAYGYLKAEKGVHRLVRISPFDANKKRHTSFASVDVLPEVNDTINIEISSGDLKIDSYRAGGAGGQHVNTTDSAVRITHLPTGIITTCQQERSQLLNREKAMKVLKAKLLDLEIKKKEDEMKLLQGEQSDIGWGNQIRSYVFQPYTMIKDHRTSCESGNIKAIMDGDLDNFINAYLRWVKHK